MIGILANNLIFYEKMLENMPKQDNSLEFIIVNETRLEDKRKEIQKLNKKYRFNAEIIGADEIIENVKADIITNNIGEKFINEYTMGLNILTQYYIFKNRMANKLLFLDDDIIIKKDLIDIFKHDFAFYKLMLGYVPNNTKYDKQIIRYYGGLIETWGREHINSGQRLYHKKIKNKYLKMLKLYLNSEIIYAEWWKHDNMPMKFNKRGFFTDQNFENCLVNRTKTTNNNLEKYCRVLWTLKMANDLKRIKDKHIIHYACKPKTKLEMLKKLKKGGAIC